LKKYTIGEIFTPSSPATVNFIEREKINTRIVSALKTKGKQIVIYGNSGSGKTTLIENKLKQVYEKHIKTNCMEGMTYENVILDAFDQLAHYYLDERNVTRKKITNLSVASTVKIIKAQISRSHEEGEQATMKRSLPPQLTGSNLAKMLGESNYCWVLEDFHKITGNDKKRLSQLMKVFMDHSDQYPELKIIALGAVNTARQVVMYDVEMRRRVAEIKVPLMTEDEIHKIIKHGCIYLPSVVSFNV